MEDPVLAGLGAQNSPVVGILTYTTFVSRMAAKAEPSRFGSRCWCDITPVLNTANRKGKQTKKQKQTNESKVV